MIKANQPIFYFFYKRGNVMIFRIKINIGLKQDFFIPHFYGNIFILNRPIEMLYRYIFNFHNQIHLMETNVWQLTAPFQERLSRLLVAKFIYPCFYFIMEMFMIHFYPQLIITLVGNTSVDTLKPLMPHPVKNFFCLHHQRRKSFGSQSEDFIMSF